MQVRTVLVIDQDPTGIATVLRKLWYRIRDTLLFAEAIEIVTAGTPPSDLVVCRYELGSGTNGIELLEELLEISPNLKIILISMADDDTLFTDPGFRKHAAHFMISWPLQARRTS